MLEVMRRTSYPSMENFFKLQILNEGIEQDGLMDVDESEYNYFNISYKCGLLL